jgi:hypothetical protein
VVVVVGVVVYEVLNGKLVIFVEHRIEFLG